MNAEAVRPSNIIKSAQLIALDWGTSSLRAYLLGEAGCILEQVCTGYGIQHLPTPGGILGFELAFKAVAGNWLKKWPNLPVVACGMVGSKQGWCEVPYTNCPVDLHELVKNAMQVETGISSPMWIVPGVRCEPVGEPSDVMRGEETQILGALLQRPELNIGVTLVLPGTHSKWAWIQEGRLKTFQTFMTGELYAILREYSTLGLLMPSTNCDDKDTSQVKSLGFRAGLDAVRTNPDIGLSHQLFGVRTLALTDKLRAQAIPEYLSGLLIAHELLSAVFDSEYQLVLAGDAVLCQRYKLAASYLGIEIHAVLDNTATQGLWAFANAIELLQESVLRSSIAKTALITYK